MKFIGGLTFIRFLELDFQKVSMTMSKCIALKYKSRTHSHLVFFFFSISLLPNIIYIQAYLIYVCVYVLAPFRFQNSYQIVKVMISNKTARYANSYNCNFICVYKERTCSSVRDLIETILYSCRRIIWLGDLNYRINLSYEKTRELISKKDWSQLAEKDQVQFFFLVQIDC